MRSDLQIFSVLLLFLSMNRRYRNLEQKQNRGAVPELLQGLSNFEFIESGDKRKKVKTKIK